MVQPLQMIPHGKHIDTMKTLFYFCFIIMNMACTKHVVHHADTAQKHIDRGDAFQRRESFALAINAYKDSLAIIPSAEAHLGLAKAFEKSKQINLALENYNLAIIVDPNLLAPYLHRGKLHQNSGDYESAKKDFNSALRLDPFSSHAFISRAHLNAAINKPHDQLEDAENAVELNPQSIEALALKAQSLHSLKQHNEALQTINQAINIEATVESIYLRGNIYKSLKETKDMCIDFQSSCQMDSYLGCEKYKRFCDLKGGSNIVIQSNIEHPYPARIEQTLDNNQQ